MLELAAGVQGGMEPQSCEIGDMKSRLLSGTFESHVMMVFATMNFLFQVWFIVQPKLSSKLASCASNETIL